MEISKSSQRKSFSVVNCSFVIHLEYRVDHYSSDNSSLKKQTSDNNILNESSFIHNNETLVESSLINEDIVIKPNNPEKQTNKTLSYNYKEDPDNPKVSS